MSGERSSSGRELDWGQLIETALTAPGNLNGVYSRFYNYSFGNQILLLMQGVREPVATYDRWRSIGRQVLRGSKAKEIVRPITVTRKDEDGEVEATFTRFKLVKCLFGYSETTGEELPPVEPSQWHLQTALDTLDIKQVPFEHLDGNCQGMSWDRNISVSPVAVFPLKTTMHEIAHVVSGHTVPENHAEYREHRGRCEFEAEGSAYLVMNELGMLSEEQASVSRGYLQTWLRGERPPDTSIRRVFSTTDAIVRAGRLAISDTSGV